MSIVSIEVLVVSIDLSVPVGIVVVMIVSFVLTVVIFGVEDFVDAIIVGLVTSLTI